jgi:hypothetical protein
MFLTNSFLSLFASASFIVFSRRPSKNTTCHCIKPPRKVFLSETARLYRSPYQNDYITSPTSSVASALVSSTYSLHRQVSKVAQYPSGISVQAINPYILSAFGLYRSHRRMVSSVLAEAKVVPSSPNATAPSRSSWPRSTAQPIAPWAGAGQATQDGVG